MQDIRYAFRMLMKAPGVTATAVATLALGIGATSAIFSFVNATLFRSLPGIADPQRVVTIGGTVDGEGFDNSAYPNFVDLRARNSVFSDVAALKPLQVGLGTGARAVRIAGALVTPSYFRVMGVRFALGGALPDGADPSGSGSSLAVISHAVWTQHFGQDASIVGRAVSVNGQPFQIAGVTARRFRGTDAMSPQDIWLPLAAARTLPGERGYFSKIDWFQTRRGVWLMLYARLRPEATLDQAETEVSAIATGLRQYPENEKAGWKVSPGAGLMPDERAQAGRIGGLLFASVGVLFLLGCANVATLTLSRVTARAREMAVRLAVGASRRRLARQLLTESLLLGLLGGTAGLLVAVWSAAGMARLFAGSSRFSLALDLSPDLRVLGFALAVSCLAGVLVGVAPALHWSRSSLLPVLKEAAGAARRPSRLRRALVVGQLALSTVLLVGAGLLLQSVRAFTEIRPGFDPANLVLLTIQPTTTGRYGDDERLRVFHQRVLDGVRTVAGVEAVTLARIAPVTPHGYGTSARLPDKPGSIVETNGLQFNTVAPDYFEVMRIPVLQGRGFTDRDTASSPLVAAINDVAARRFWPGEESVGKSIWLAGEPQPRRVVGVVGTLKYRNLVERSYPLAYYSISQSYPMPEAPAVLHLRTRLPLALAAAEVERVVREIDPEVPVFDVKSVAGHLADSYWQQRVVAIVVGILAGLAMVLGSVGIYGVMAVAAAERTRETGIRMALGATTADIIRLFTNDALRLISLGVILGVALARASARGLSALLYGVTAGDLLTYAAAAALLAAVALVACTVPAIRAVRVDPLLAVRSE